MSRAAVHGRHGQYRFVVANEEGDQFRRLFVAGISRYLVHPVRRLVEAFPRFEYGLGAAPFIWKRIAPCATYPITVQGWLCGLSASPGA